MQSVIIAGPRASRERGRLAKLGNFRDVLKPLRRLYGATAAADFGPRALRAIRDQLIASGWCRNVVNRQVSRIRQVLKWGVATELVPPHQYQALLTVEGIFEKRR